MRRGRANLAATSGGTMAEAMRGWRQRREGDGRGSTGDVGGEAATTTGKKMKGIFEITKSKGAI